MGNKTVYNYIMTRSCIHIQSSLKINCYYNNINTIQYLSYKISYPILSFLSSGVHKRFGAITIAKFCGLILLTS